MRSEASAPEGRAAMAGEDLGINIVYQKPVFVKAYVYI
jgi:hypothetical protein